MTQRPVIRVDHIAGFHRYRGGKRPRQQNLPGLERNTVPGETSKLTCPDNVQMMLAGVEKEADQDVDLSGGAVDQSLVVKA